jgi:hypothetical protein
MSLISWGNTKQFMDEDLEGFSYFLPYMPANQNYTPCIVNIENLKRFYSTCGINQKVSKYFIDQIDDNLNFYPHYATFSIENELPVKYGFRSFIDERTHKFINTFYSNYTDIEILLEFMETYFPNHLYGIQLSATNHEQFSIEMGMDYEKYTSMIEEIKSNDRFLKLCGDNIKELSVPAFVGTVVFKFKWENKDTKRLKAYVETNDKDIVENILFN